MNEFFDKLKRYFRFSQNELEALAISVFILTLIVSFRNLVLTNILGNFLILTLSLFFHVSAQKAIALSKGYSVEYNLWWYGLLIGVIVALLSNGAIWWVLLPGGISFSMIARHRLGRFRYGLNYWLMGFLAFFGPIASIILGTMFKNIELYLIGAPVGVLDTIFRINLVLAVCTMIPLPPLDGHYMFYASRSWFVILFSTILVYTVLTMVFGIYSWIWAIIAALITWFVYYIKFEIGSWEGN